MKRKMMYQVCYAIAALWALPQGASAAGIATVLDVVNDGYRTPPGAEETTAKSKDELVQNEALRTEEESVIEVQFVDGSQLSVEQSSEMVLSDYVFDGSATAGLINLNNGLFHFKSGAANDQGVKLRTPVATIGVRGTEFLVHVDGDDATVIDILSGAVSAKPHGSGQEITCVEGQSILVASPDEDAICGDIGSFSTAAGGGNDGNDGPERGARGNDRDKKGGAPLDRFERDDDEGSDDGTGDGGTGDGGTGDGGTGDGGTGDGGTGDGGTGDGGTGDGGTGDGGTGDGGTGDGGTGDGGTGDGGTGDGGTGDGGTGDGGTGDGEQSGSGVMLLNDEETIDFG
jgi:FecR-like protein